MLPMKLQKVSSNYFHFRLRFDSFSCNFTLIFLQECIIKVISAPKKIKIAINYPNQAKYKRKIEKMKFFEVILSLTTRGLIRQPTADTPT